MKLTAAMLYEKLGVSREWVRNHCRHLGEKRTGDSGYTVYYDLDQLLQWLNEKAEVKQQIKLVDATRYLSKIGVYKLDEIRNSSATIDGKLEQIKRLVTYECKCKPDFCEQYFKVNQRKRSDVSWEKASYTIKSLDDIKTMKQIKAENNFRSDEMAARYVYLNGMLKITICGRVWYAKQPNRPENYLEMPAKFEEA